jgi:hypothetical protein
MATSKFAVGKNYDTSMEASTVKAPKGQKSYFPRSRKPAPILKPKSSAKPLKKSNGGVAARGKEKAPLFFARKK